MKRLFVLLAAATLAAISGCQKEPVGNENESAKAYAQLNITFANSITKSTTSGNADDSGIYDAGTEDEYAVKSATLYFVKAGGNEDGTDPVEKISTLANFTTQKVGNDVYYTHVVEGLDQGAYRIYATVNHALNITPKQGDGVENTNPTTEKALREWVTESAVSGTSTATGIPMSSRKANAVYGADAEAAGLYVKAVITGSHTKDNPCQISLEIERAWAKIAYDASDNENKFEIKANRGSGDKIADVILTNYQVLNQTQRWHAFRRAYKVDDVGSLVDNGFGAFNDVTDPLAPVLGYLYEPETSNKSKGAVNTYAGMTDGTVAALSTSDQVLAYAYENSLHKDAQLAGYVTTVRFTGKLTPVTVWAAVKDTDGTVTDVEATTEYTDLYFYRDEFFKDLDALNHKYPLGVNDSNCKDFNVKVYKNTECYYDYYIKHFDNQDYPNMGVMEYAIVRNNSYNIAVKEILSPGNDDADDVDPETPVEQVETYFQVQLIIKPWIVRAQSAVLG